MTAHFSLILRSMTSLSLELHAMDIALKGLLVILDSFAYGSENGFADYCSFWLMI